MPEIVDCGAPVYPVVRCLLCGVELVRHEGSYGHRGAAVTRSRLECPVSRKRYRLLTPISFELVEDDAEIKREGDAVVETVERLVVRER